MQRYSGTAGEMAAYGNAAWPCTDALEAEHYTGALAAQHYTGELAAQH